MKIIVADTSIFLAVALEEPEKEKIITLTSGFSILAPEILSFEMGNALSSLVKRNILSESQALQAWAVTRKIQVSLKPINIENSLALAFNFKRYAYDFYFLSLAIQEKCALLTLDKGMAELARKLKI
ncbi:MAG: type II toxin-antitoxin system VapC family toxin [Lentisphaerota bacterium]